MSRNYIVWTLSNMSPFMKIYWRKKFPIFMSLYSHVECLKFVVLLIFISLGNEDREVELSHPVHADNCLIQSDGSCKKDPMAYMQRHYR